LQAPCSPSLEILHRHLLRSLHYPLHHPFCHPFSRPLHSLLLHRPLTAPLAAAEPKPSISYQGDGPGARPGVAVIVQFTSFELEPIVLGDGFEPEEWTVEPAFPDGIELDESDGIVSGAGLVEVGSGAPVERHYWQERTAYTITAVHGDISVTCQLTLKFVASPLRTDMGTCLACGEEIADEADARAAACPTKSVSRPHGIHAYCHECFNHMVRALQADAIPLQCTACRDPASKQNQRVVLFSDQQIMEALSDHARARYVKLVQEKQPAGTERVYCGQGGCDWTCDVPEGKLENLVYCGDPECGKVTCRKCELEVRMEGQDARGWVVHGRDGHKRARLMNEKNELVMQTHLISCALELQVDEICTRGLAVPCPACGVRTQKDDACTHMVCSDSKCGTRYCYCCGLARLDCDGAGADSWYGHNQDWKTNPRRCPVYLEFLSDIADGTAPAAGRSSARNRKWPKEASDALRVFHHERVLRALQVLIKGADRVAVQNVLVSTMGGFTYGAIVNFRERPWFARRKLPAL
jgi:hypothetical protein